MLISKKTEKNDLLSNYLEYLENLPSDTRP